MLKINKADFFGDDVIAKEPSNLCPERYYNLLSQAHYKRISNLILTPFAPDRNIADLRPLFLTNTAPSTNMFTSRGGKPEQLFEETPCFAYCTVNGTLEYLDSIQRFDNLNAQYHGRLILPNMGMVMSFTRLVRDPELLKALGLEKAVK